MGTDTQQVLSMIGAMQTLIENFPMGLLSSLNIKKYNSVMDFLMDVFSGIGISSKDIIEFLLTEIIVPKLNIEDLNRLDDFNEDLLNSPFMDALEDVLKSIIAFILSEILSCSIRPKVPSRLIENGGTNGVDISIKALDPTNLLDTCPTSEVGKYLYTNVSSGDTPNSLDKCKDLNAVMWYSLYKGDVTWSGTTQNKKICTLRSFNTYNKIRFSIDSSFSNSTMFNFNRQYLNSIKIFSPKVLISALYDELINGLPEVGIYYRITDVFSDAVLNNVIKTVVGNDDMEINDCFYSFSNEDWDKMLEEHELQKYSGKRLNSETATAIEIDKEAVMDALNSASSAATLYDQKTIIENSFYDIAATPSQDASVFQSDGLDLVYNNNWLSDMLISLVRPIVKAAMSPKVMALILVNYDAAGLINLSDINLSDFSSILDLIKKKLLGILSKIIKAIKDAIVKALMSFLAEKILPLITKYSALKLLEKIEAYIAILQQALECIRLFWISPTSVLTTIDDVNYADIIPEKITPEQSIC